jgi:hypothetical protein
MATVTLRPDGTAANVGWAINGGSPSAHVAIADVSDATYLSDTYYAADPQPTSGTFNFGTSAIPAGAYIKSVTPRIRFDAFDYLKYAVRSSKVGSPFYGAGMVILNPPNGTPTTVTGGASAPVYSDVQNEVDSLQLYLQSQAALAVGPGACRVFDVYLDVVYNVAPAVSSVTATGFTITTRPTIGWGYSDTEGDAQERYRVKVFTATQVAAGGFAPETSTPAWDSGEVYSAATSAVVATDLVVGTSHTAYVKAADAGSNGRYSAWAASAPFTVQVNVPAAPTIVSVTPTTDAGLALAIQAAQNLLSTDDASVEATLGTWAANANCSVSRDTAFGIDGSSSVGLSSTAAGDMSARTASGTSGYPVLAGQAYTARASFRPSSFTRNALVSIVWYNAAGAVVTTTAGTAGSAPSGSWTERTLNATAPAGAAFAALLATVQATAGAAETVKLDRSGIMPGTSSAWTRGGLAASQVVEVQRTYDAGATWEPVHRMTTLLPPAASQGLSATDYTSRPNTPVAYRARSSGVDGALTVYSAWSATSSSASPSVTDVWLKDPADPTANTKLGIAGDLTSTSDEAQGKFLPLGRSRAVIVGGDIYGEEFQLPIVFRTDADWARFEVLRKRQKTLLLQSDMTTQWWVRLGPTRDAVLVNNVTRRTAPARQVQVAATEVDGV